MLNAFEETPARDRVIVALDCGIDEAFDLADRLQGKATWMKAVSYTHLDVYKRQEFEGGLQLRALFLGCPQAQHLAAQHDGAGFCNGAPDAALQSLVGL